MKTVLQRFTHYQDRFQQQFGHIIAWSAVTLVLLSALVVVLRYGFNTGSIALQESIMYNHAILFMLGMAYTYQQDQHVRVDVFYSQFAAKTKAWINLVGTLGFALPAMAFIIWAGWDYVAASWRIAETSTESGGLAYLYMLKSLILIMAALVILQVLSHAAHAYLQIVQPEIDEDPHALIETEGKL